MAKTFLQRCGRLTVLLGGALIVGVCTYFLLLDWAALDRAYVAFQRSREGHNALDMAYYGQVQLAHRINCLAEGLGVLFGTRLLALGLLGR